MTQRLENTEKGSKNDITELFARIKRYEEEARIDNDEVRTLVKRKANLFQTDDRRFGKSNIYFNALESLMLL